MRTVDELARVMVDSICEADPVAATNLGVHEHDHRLGPWDAATHEALARDLRGIARELGAHLGDDRGPAETLDARALHGALATRLLELEEEQLWRRNPERAVESALNGCAALVLRDSTPRPERVAALRDRLGELPAFLERARATWSDVPGFWARSGAAAASAGAGFVDRDLALALDPDERASMAEQIARAVDALRTTAAALASEPDRGAPWRAGESTVREHLRLEHHLPDTPAEMAERGRRLVADTRLELESLDPTWRDAVDRLKLDHPSADALVDTYRTEMELARDFVLAHGLAPDTPAALDVRATPAFMRATSPYAAYDPPGFFEPDQRGVFWVTVPDGPASDDQLRDHARAWITITAIHEGYPGHHQQMTRANAVAGLTRTLAESALTIEGWAFYCEQMLWEVGYYESAGLRLAQLKDQLWRAVRVVVDMELHCGDLGFDAAVSQLVDGAGLEPDNARAEVLRYTSSPTYQICYAIGKAEILALRERWRTRAGTAFDLGRFHEELLSYGNVAVPLVAAAMLE